jgi:hypothetical protein
MISASFSTKESGLCIKFGLVVLFLFSLGIATVVDALTSPIGNSISETELTVDFTSNKHVKIVDLLPNGPIELYN